MPDGDVVPPPESALSRQDTWKHHGLKSLEIGHWFKNLFYRENAMGLFELFREFLGNHHGNEDGHGHQANHRNGSGDTTGSQSPEESPEDPGGLTEVRTWP